VLHHVNEYYDTATAYNLLFYIYVLVVLVDVI